MTGPSTFLAFCEMNRIAEAALPTVRKELFRLGCLSAFVISSQEGCLKITRKEDAVLVDPSELLALLERTGPNVAVDLLWKQIKETAMVDLGAGCSRLNLPLVIVFVTVFFILALGLIAVVVF